MAMRVTPELTRRRDPDAQQETWLIHYGDVRVSVISERAVGNPDSTRAASIPAAIWQSAQAALPRASTRRVAPSRPRVVCS
jgi:hypothetical protein